MPPPLAARIAELASLKPDSAAYLGDSGPMSWREYDGAATRLARLLVGLGLAPGERVAVLLPDGPGIHVAFVATERAGLVAVGIGPRAGFREIEFVLQRSGAQALLSPAAHQGEDMAGFVERLRRAGLPLRHHLVVAGELATDDPISVDGSLAPTDPGVDAATLRERSLGAADLFLLNTTSGTTGMPKCVMHDQLRWFAFHEFAVARGGLGEDDVFMSLVPAPFGFGIWTAHFSPALLGVPTVVPSRFDPEAALAQIEAQRVTVLAAVSTQFILMLNSPEFDACDLSSLRVMFTGGEAVPYERAAAFEDRTGAMVLQFYGSNETGAVSGTALSDPRDKRLRTAGRPIPEMNLRLFDAAGADVTATGQGQPGCRGPTLSRGYYGDDPETAAANAELVRADGWMLLGDLVELDADGYLRVIGRSDDFIIRGGKNISGAAVEEQVVTHPAVSVAAAVAMPDEVFGERVCVYVELAEAADSLELRDLVAHLAARDVSKENFPERIEVVSELPLASGGKVAKQQLRDDIRRRLASERG